jgi:hypothetical protein
MNVTTVHTQNLEELGFTLLMVWSGIIVNACLITVLGTLLINSDHVSARRADEFDELDAFMDLTRMTPKLKTLLKEFRAYTWSRTSGTDPAEFTSGMVPEHEQLVYEHMYMRHISVSA